MVSTGPFLLTMLNHEYSNFQKSQKFQSVSHNFNNILISSASFHISKTQSSKKPKPWINLHVRAKTCNRNHLRRTIHQNIQDWTDACREANVAINEAKANSRKNLLHISMSNSDGPDVW